MPRKLSRALSRPVRVDSTLGAIVGHKPLPSAQIVKKLWGYIKRHKLQSPSDGRVIVADSKLALVLGKRSANMMEMMKLVERHIDRR
jgi:chromatin remodeling complex protein RSC6